MRTRTLYRSGTPKIAFVFLAGWLIAVPGLAREYRFDVTADGIAIGSHDIVVQENGDTRSVKSDMRFGKLGISAYQQHEEESWKGDCLARLDSKTEEKGSVTTISGKQEGGGFRIDGPNKQQLPECVMSFAYWNPKVLKQSHLVNVQTGAWTPITVKELGKASIDVHGKSVQANHYGIDTDKNQIEVFYSPEGDWVGLKTTTKSGGHVLVYSPR